MSQKVFPTVTMESRELFSPSLNFPSPSLLSILSSREESNKQCGGKLL